MHATSNRYLLDVDSKFEVSFLIEKLKENLKDHKESFKLATEIYNKEIIEGLKALSLLSGRQSKTEYDKVTLLRAYNDIANKSKPVDETKKYEQYISIFGSTTEKSIVLNINDANSIINDSWDWAIQAKTSNMFYTSKIN